MRKEQGIENLRAIAIEVDKIAIEIDNIAKQKWTLYSDYELTISDLRFQAKRLDVIADKLEKEE